MSYQVEAQSGAEKATATWRVLVDDHEFAARPISFENSKTKSLELTVHPMLGKGPHRLEFEMVPGEGAENVNVPLAVKVLIVVTSGPPNSVPWENYPESVRRILDDGPPPEEAAGREDYARRILRRLATRAYRQPVGEETLEKLVALARAKEEGEGGDFQAGIRFALTAVLSSPDFLLRGELPGKGDGKRRGVPLDEYALATRLSYFLWSSAPDGILLDLAGEGKLRDNLRATVDRLLADPKAERFIRNFVGQWLQIRELDGMTFDTPLLLGIEDGNRARQIFNLFTREDMMRETQMFFAHLLRANRPAMELITADYTFLNDRLATFYGVGRGVEYYDAPAVDGLIRQAEAAGGGLREFLYGVVESAPFQMVRAE